jgi:5-methylthioadenosine/S-adenosylhomocysteine deaminase
MATRDGARALGLSRDIGSIETGKKADVIVVGVSGVHQSPPADPYSTLVYASRAADVRVTVIDGRIVARDGQLMWADRRDVTDAARTAASRLRARAGVCTMLLYSPLALVSRDC